MPMQRSTPRIVKLTRDDLPEAVEVLAQAFTPDPLMQFLFHDAPGTFGDNLRELFHFSCEVRLLLDWPLLGSRESTQLVGVAGITEPEDKPWNDALIAVYDTMKVRIGPAATKRLEGYSSHIDAYRPRDPHYHLGMLGVHPNAQGQGHGRSLLDAVQQLSEAHPASTGVWLDTENPRSVQIYERCGYHVVAQTKFDTVDIWCMFRPNRV